MSRKFPPIGRLRARTSRSTSRSCMLCTQYKPASVPSAMLYDGMQEVYLYLITCGRAWEVMLAKNHTLLSLRQYRRLLMHQSSPTSSPTALSQHCRHHAATTTAPFFTPYSPASQTLLNASTRIEAAVSAELSPGHLTSLKSLDVIPSSTNTNANPDALAATYQPQAAHHDQ